MEVLVRVGGLTVHFGRERAIIIVQYLNIQKWYNMFLFSLRSELDVLVDGTARSPVSVVIANIVMEHIEDLAPSMSLVPTVFWKRYMMSLPLLYQRPADTQSHCNKRWQTTSTASIVTLALPLGGVCDRTHPHHPNSFQPLIRPGLWGCW